MTAWDRMITFEKRFGDELGYEYVYSWPIYGRCKRVMYYMIHASDHPEAPKLMERAYRMAVLPKEPEALLFKELGVSLN